MLLRSSETTTHERSSRRSRYCWLNPTEGSEQRGTRPCLVVQNDVGNENAPTSIVVPFTTSSGEKLYPFEVLISAAESPLREDSVALCSQIAPFLSEHRIRDNIGSILETRLEEVDTALEYSLGLKEL